MKFSEYTNYDAIGLADLVRRKQVSATELLDTAINRINSSNTYINAVVQNLEPYARKQIKHALNDGIFTGVPFLLKDTGINLKGVTTSNGSHFIDRKPAARNSTLTDYYLKSGLVIFGKTNTPEYAISGSTESKALGKCHNPWDLTRSTGGSSGGAAAAVAMGYAPMAHASDGGGSIRNPSSNCGVFGLKPTRGRVVSGPETYQGVGGMSEHHTITRSVRDSAAVLDATCAQRGMSCVDQTGKLSFLGAIKQPIKPLRIAFHLDAHHSINIDPECHRATLSAAKLCEDLGHTVEEVKPNIDGIMAMKACAILWKVSAAQCIEDTARALGRAPKHGETEWITQLLAKEGADIKATDYAEAINTMHHIGHKLITFFKQYDVVLSPVLSQPPWLLDVYENKYTDTQTYFETVFAYSPFCWPYNMSGQPAMSVPLYWTNYNLPIGVQFAGRYGDEATLFSLARQLEIARPWFNRRPHI